jgi:hypothetical protein
MYSIWIHPTRPLVTIRGLDQREAADAAVLALRCGASHHSDLNRLQEDGTVTLTVGWPDSGQPATVAHPDGPVEVREFLRLIDGWSTAVLAR